MVDEFRQAIGNLENTDDAVRQQAQRLLLSDDLKAFEALVASLQERKAVSRVALLLAAKCDRAALLPLAQAAEDKVLEASERAFAVRAMAELVDGRDAFDEYMMSVCANLACDPDPLMRALVASVYKAIGGLENKKMLSKLSQDSDTFVQAAASLR